MIRHARRVFTTLVIIAALVAILTGCGGNNSNSTTNKGSSTRSYTDYKGHTVEIPASPERVIFAGETTGDLPQLGIQPVGVFGDDLADRVYVDLLTQAQNIGFPINLELVTSLNPDLIVVANTDEKAYETLAKIAPTIMFDTFGTLEYRMNEWGEIFNKQLEAEAWLKDYEDEAAAMWSKLYNSGLQEGETASVFTYYPGDRLFVMARAGLSQLIYGAGGLKPPGPIQEVLDANEGFRQISLEVIEQFAGDHIFILNPVADEAKQSTEALLNNPIWNNLPAVKNGHVYQLDILKSDSDASTRKWLLEELPRLMIK